MTRIAHPNNRQEHSVPWFWPYAAALELGERGAHLFADNLRFLEESQAITAPPESAWATPNQVRLELDTMRLRDFSTPGADAIAVLVDAPYAGHSATIADHAPGQSLVRTLLANGLRRVLVTDWKSATDAMRQFDIDKYLAELNVVVDDLGGAVHLVGLCQGGWMSAMFAARFPHKVRSLVLAGSPIDTQAGQGPLKELVNSLPANYYDNLVRLGHGRMPGRMMLAGWKGMHPGQQYMEKYLDLYQHIEDKSYIKRTEAFERWYENPLDLPGAFYLQAIHQLFKENRLFEGKFVGLGQRLSLRAIQCPAYLLAGAADDITPAPQVFAAAGALGTPAGQIVRKTAPGGHIGLFMGSSTLSGYWPAIAHWIATRAA